MQELTKNAIKKLLKETSHVLSVEDFDLIERLDSYAEKVSGVSRTERRLLNSPFEVDGIKFYPLTVAKSLWYVEKVEEWEIHSAYQDGFFFWLLTLPLNDDVLIEYSDFKKTNRAMKKLARSLHFTHDQIKDVCEKCCGSEALKSVQTDGEQESSGKKQANVFGGMVASLIREFGQSPEYWLYECPIDQLNEMYAQLVARIVSEEESARSQSAKSGKAVAPRATPKLVAFKAFRDFVNVIREKWSVTDGE